MMTYPVNTSLPAARALILEGGSSCSQRGLDAAEYPPPFRNLRMGAGGGQAAAFRQNRMRFPVIQQLSREMPNVTKDDRLEPENSYIEDISGRHFLFDKNCVKLERTRTVIPPLPRDYHVRRPANLHPFGLSRELSHSHAGRPFTLGYPAKYEANTCAAILFPSAFVLNGSSPFTVENCKLNRPKVNYPTYNPLTVKDNQKSQSYPDPMVGASCSFIHRISALSSLEGETVKQEKLKKMRRPKKPPS
ncbi:putative uncharacterized protein C8orf89 homolog [Parambassis ranga]|uniref:Uncharacterized protein n=1 Tax=Parambassis ranga TaxID=210632 RepID=A0A6P7KIM8_9TELE|nr:uncharacterized protein LOC114453587 [Parambassis ranga]